MTVACCVDCGLAYGSDRWIEAVIPDEAWARISPTGHGGGLLCIACISRRLLQQGMRDVPVMLLGTEAIRAAREDEIMAAGRAIGERNGRESVSRELEGLRRATRLRADYAFRCDGCGAPHWLDTSIRSEVWNRIAPEGGMLCVLCIDERCAALGIKTEAEFYFVGDAVSSKLYAESHGCVAAAERESAALRGDLDALRQQLGEPSREPTLEEIVRETIKGGFIWSEGPGFDRAVRVVRARLSSPEAPREPKSTWPLESHVQETPPLRGTVEP